MLSLSARQLRPVTRRSEPMQHRIRLWLQPRCSRVLVKRTSRTSRTTGQRRHLPVRQSRTSLLDAHQRWIITIRSSKRLAVSKPSSSSTMHSRNSETTPFDQAQHSEISMLWTFRKSSILLGDTCFLGRSRKRDWLQILLAVNEKLLSLSKQLVFRLTTLWSSTRRIRPALLEPNQRWLR